MRESAKDSFTHESCSCAQLMAQTSQKDPVYMVQVLPLQQEVDLFTNSNIQGTPRRQTVTPTSVHLLVFLLCRLEFCSSDCSSLLTTTEMLVYRWSRLMMYKTLSFMRKTPGAQFTDIHYRHIEIMEDVCTALELQHTNTS